jgi:hypothetical protein
MENFIVFHHILDSTSFSKVVLVPAGRSGKKLIPVSCSILDMLVRY